MEDQPIAFYQERDFGSKLSVTISFLRKNVGKLALTMMLVALPLVLVVGFFMTDTFRFVSDLPFIEDTIDESAFVSIFLRNYIVMMLALWLGTSLLIAVSMTYLKIYNDGKIKDYDVFAIVRASFSKYGGVLILSLITFIMILIGFFLFVLPGFFLVFVLPIFFATYIFEDISVGRAISKSFSLMSGKWLSTFGVGLICWVLAYGVQVVFSVPLFLSYFAGFGAMLEQVANSPDDPSAFTEFFSDSYFMVGLLIATLGGYLSYCIPLTGWSYQYASLAARSKSSGSEKELGSDILD